MELPLEHFGHRGQLDELVVVPGAALLQNLILRLLPPLRHLSTTSLPPLYYLSTTSLPPLYQLS